MSFVVAQANDLCRDHGLWCGFEDMEPGATLTGTGADDPIRTAALARLGGFEMVVERANAFLHASPVVPARRQPAEPRPIQDASSPRSAPWAVSDRFPDRFGGFRRQA